MSTPATNPPALAIDEEAAAQTVEMEPTVRELVAIEAEWPLIAAELAVVEAQCRFLGSPDVLARRALRRAVAGLTRTYAEFYGPGALTHPPLDFEPQEPLAQGAK